MTDLEMIKKCAEKMGVEFPENEWDEFLCNYEEYDPLNDDAQAMALVKAFGIQIFTDENRHWNVRIKRTDFAAGASANRFPDLNRAIVQCVAHLP